MDYRILQENLIEDQLTLVKLRQMVDACARKLNILPLRLRKKSLWTIRLNRIGHQAYHLSFVLDWPAGRMEMSREGENLLPMAGELLEEFRTRVAAEVKQMGNTDRTS